MALRSVPSRRTFATARVANVRLDEQPASVPLRFDALSASATTRASA